MKKENSVNEVDALRTIHEALKPLDSDTRSRVLQAVMTLLQISAPAAISVTQQPKTQLDGILVDQGTQFIQSTTTIDKFVAGKQPVDTYQRLACLAYFLEHKENKIDLSVKELKKANTDARQSNISNISQFLDLATRRHGFFTPAGHGKKRLSIRGSTVVEALPDQAAVKNALKHNPLPRKGGRKPKAKAKS